MYFLIGPFDLTLSFIGAANRKNPFDLLVLPILLSLLRSLVQLPPHFLELEQL